MSSTNDAASRRYSAVVFKRTTSTEDFSCSTKIVLPGQHTEQEAWQAVRDALRDRSYIGGEVRAIPCAAH